MEFHFAQTKRKRPIINAELQRGGRICQRFHVFKLPLVLSSIDLVLGSVIVLTLVGLQTQRLHRVSLTPHGPYRGLPLYPFFQGNP